MTEDARITVRFDLSNEEQRRAWHRLFDRDRKKYPSYAAYLTDCICRCEDHDADIEATAKKIAELLGNKLTVAASVQENALENAENRTPEPAEDWVDWDFLGL